MKKITSLLLGFGAFFSFTVIKAAAFTNPVIGGDLGADMEAASSGATFVNYFVNVWQAFITIGAILVLIYFLWGALEWITAGGESSKVETARNRITQSMLGLLILVSSFVIIEFISTIFFGDEFSILKLQFTAPDSAPAAEEVPESVEASTKTNLSKYNFFAPPAAYAAEVDLDIGGRAESEGLPGTEDYKQGDGEAGFGLFIGRILDIVIVIGALMVFLNLIWGAMEWITAGGDSGKVEGARNKITQSIIGLIVLVSAVALFALIQNFLGIEVLTFN